MDANTACVLILVACAVGVLWAWGRDGATPGW